MGLSGPLAEQRAIKRLKDAYIKGTSNENVLALMAKAEWMMRTGHTSAEWEELPAGDMQLIVLHYQFSKMSDRTNIQCAIAEAFGSKKGAK